MPTPATRATRTSTSATSSSSPRWSSRPAGTPTRRRMTTPRSTPSSRPCGERSLLVGGGGLVAGVALFYVLGGRNVIRRHRSALARATRDGMTDLPNQRAFHDELPHAISAAARYDEPLALVMLDIDDFKFLNDRYGHPHGDAVIQRVAQILSDRRPSDRAYRVGGDEFAAVLPHTDREGVYALTRRTGAPVRGRRSQGEHRPRVATPAASPPPTACAARPMRPSTRPSGAAGTRSSTTRRSARPSPSRPPTRRRPSGACSTSAASTSTSSRSGT